MRYESPKTAMGNVGVSYVSAEKAVEQAQEMDNNGCNYCTGCTGCKHCKNCKNCKYCTDCKYCTGCTGCKYCTGCTGFVDGKPGISPEQQIINLDKAGAVILENVERLEMRHWHGSSDWIDRSCAEEAVCGTTHCLAGWLQVCATDPEIRAMDTQTAGALQAPVSAKMFFSDQEEVLAWLRDREYAKELGVVESTKDEQQ